MTKQYVVYENITKELLDTVNVGDLILTNDSKQPLRWRTIAEHDPLKELTGLAADVNVNEIADHIRNGTLAQWVESWQMQMQMALELENCRLSATELEKLRRENFGLKTTVNNLRAQVDKFYRRR